MAIKGGQLIHVANQVLIDRAQTAGPGTVTINREKVYELGNYQSIGQTSDIPDMTFTLESFDASAEFEALLTNRTFSAQDVTTGVETISMTDGTVLRPAAAVPIDVVSAFKPGLAATAPYAVVGSAAIPYLTLESLSYRFGLQENASQSATLRGDSIYYNPGSSWVQTAVGTNTVNQAIVLAHPAVAYRGDIVAGVRYVLSVSLSTGERLSYAADFTEAATGAGASKAVTVTILDAVPATTTIRVVYASDDPQTYPQVSHAPVTSVRPAAIRGRHIRVFVGTAAGQTTAQIQANPWTGVQSMNLDYRVTLQRDEEFGNSQIVAQDFDIPEVSGSLSLRPRDYADLYNRIRAISGTNAGEVAGPLTTTPLPLLIQLHSPDDGAILKSFYVKDARFNMPGYSGRVQQKLDVTFDWTSDSGDLVIYKGGRPA